MACAERSLGRSEAPDSSEGLKGPDSGDRIAQALKASFKDLDAQILAEEQKQGVEKGAFGGCTAVVALAMGDVSPSANSNAHCTVICIAMVGCSCVPCPKLAVVKGYGYCLQRVCKAYDMHPRCQYSASAVSCIFHCHITLYNVC